MGKRITIILSLIILLFSLSACNKQNTGNISLQLALNRGTVSYNFEQLVELYTQNRVKFHEIADLFMNKGTYWQTLYDETGWHCYMHNYQRSEDFFNNDELVLIDDFYDRTKPYEIRFDNTTKNGENLEYLRFCFLSEDDLEAYDILYVNNGAENPTLEKTIFEGWIYKKIYTLEDGEWFIIGTSI